MTKSEFIENLKALSHQPKLYTPTGSFYEIVSFVEGLAFGGNLDDTQYHSKMTPFKEWLAVRYETPEPIIDWTDYRNRYSSDSEAISDLSRLFAEFSRLEGS